MLTQQCRCPPQLQQPDTDAAGARCATADMVAPVLVQPSAASRLQFGREAPPSPAPTLILNLQKE